MWNSAAELHAALNDLPAALFVASVVFDLAGHFGKRDSLRAAGFWTLVAAGVGAVLALVSGLSAEAAIEHGSVMHRFVERHQTLAILFTVFVGGLVAWRVWRRSAFSPTETKAYLAAALVGIVGILWTAKVGGNIMFRHAGGIETAVLQSALAEREAGHEHAPGEEHDDGVSQAEPVDGEGTATEHEHD